MAKPLVFQLGDRDLSFNLAKVDRAKLYGYKEVEVLDDKGGACDLATLASDGQTVVGRGGTGMGYLSGGGEWCDKGDLKPIDLDGAEITPVASSYSQAIKLFETVTAEEYLSHNIRTIYRLETEDAIDDLMEELDRGTIFAFPYSFRGGLEADAAFMLKGDDGNVFLAVGQPTKIEFIGIQPSISVIDDTDGDNETDLMDFDMI
ncbi:hypothetical protein [Aeoliella sp.]|uniref:hypothetical protein n=1 Tax=Aeoliella sp. TaxID=2795800 RepID=UPI003CCC2786